MTFLFDKIIFGPVSSRRLGVSLGINLLPLDYKYCTFNCIYCECGWTEKSGLKEIKLPTRTEVYDHLETKLADLKAEGPFPDAITFAGNGEPTVHPEFPGIIDDTIALRDKYFPECEITVLSNASRLDRDKIFKALYKVDKNIQKLDAGTEETFRLINKPVKGLDLNNVVANLKKFEKNLIIQSLFLRGTYKGKIIDNTTEQELKSWLQLIKDIRPLYVMIYSIDRGTPAENLKKVPFEELKEIGILLEKEGIKSQIYG